jgi:hypothetical protein
MQQACKADATSRRAIMHLRARVSNTDVLNVQGIYRRKNIAERYVTDKSNGTADQESFRKAKARRSFADE